MRGRFLKLAAPILIFAWAGAARAQNCEPSRYVTGVPMTPSQTNTMMVPVGLNGIPKMMMLDTGGGVTQLTRATLDELHLSESRSAFGFFDIEGNVSRTQAQLRSFSLGSLDLADVALQVNPNPNFGRPFAGLLSGDLLADYDVDLDFGSDRLNLFSPGNCSQKTLYWPDRRVAEIPFAINDFHITIPVMLDGHQLSAIIDTGAPITTLSLEAARRAFDLTGDALGPNRLSGADNDKRMAIYSHRFSAMTFEGVSVTNPAALITQVPAMPPNGRRLRSGNLPDLIIGMEILRELHIYIAYRDKKLYITKAHNNDASLLPPLSNAPAQ